MPVKRLTLMRHADARWQDAGLSDLERPLNRRGSAAAEAMARRLAELKLVPEAEASGLATAALCSIVVETPHWTAIGVAPVKDVLRETPPARRLFGLFG